MVVSPYSFGTCDYSAKGLAELHLSRTRKLCVVWSATRRWRCSLYSGWSKTCLRPGNAAKTVVMLDQHQCYIMFAMYADFPLNFARFFPRQKKKLVPTWKHLVKNTCFFLGKQLRSCILRYSYERFYVGTFLCRNVPQPTARLDLAPILALAAPATSGPARSGTCDRIFPSVPWNIPDFSLAWGKKW